MRLQYNIQALNCPASHNYSKKVKTDNLLLSFTIVLSNSTDFFMYIKNGKIF
jgi:hypothetical protein